MKGSHDDIDVGEDYQSEANMIPLEPANELLIILS